MNINNKILDLIRYGINKNMISGLNENQINLLHNRLLESKKENKEAVTKTSTTTTYDLGNAADVTAANKALGGTANVDPVNKKMIVTKEENDIEEESTKDLDEKFESKSQQKYFWAKCNRSKGEEKTKWCNMAKEFSDATTKKDYKKMPEKIHPEKTVKVKKEQKEGYLDMVGKGITKANLMNLDKISPSVKWESQLEKRISQLVESHLNPKMTKEEILKYIKEQKVKPAPVKEPGTKEPKKVPDTPYKPKPGTKPSPKAKKEETKEQLSPTIAPPKPATPTKPGPSTPYKPKPGTKPSPKAGRKDIPNWLDFKSIGIKLK
jgi:hypothetical protein